MTSSPAPDATFERTLDLHALARVTKGERVEVEARRGSPSTDELFQRTLRLIPPAAEVLPPPERRAASGTRYIPENADLRKIYLFAEALGGYERVHEILDVHGPGRRLSRQYVGKGVQRPLTEAEARTLLRYQHQLHHALQNAHNYLAHGGLEHFHDEELHELSELLTTASHRAEEITRIIGLHLMCETEEAVRRLSGYQQMIRSVHRTIDGIFLVNSEVMFIPASELMNCVTTIFRGVSNSYLAEHIDGVLLLAARNLLIDIISFHSYCGKEQIYHLIRRGGSTSNTQLITDHIRREVHKLFAACQVENRLILRRVMHNAAREFELSVQAVANEAVRSAVEQVWILAPRRRHPPAPVKKSMLTRLLSWLWGS